MCRFRVVVRPYYPGFWVFFAALLFTAFCLAVGALGADLPPVGQRTVSWYSRPENRGWLDHVWGLCQDNPGLMQKDPDCLNAERARLAIAENEARRSAGLSSSDPASRRYWTDRYDSFEHRQQLSVCGRAVEPPPLLARVCDAARGARRT